MRYDKIPKLALFSLVFVLLLSVAHAAECTGTFSGPTENVYPGNTFTLNFFNAEAGSAGADLELMVPAGATNLSTNPVVGISPFTLYSWDVVASADGTYLFTANMTGVVNCHKNFTLDVVDNVTDPNISINVQNVADVTVNQAFTYDVVLTNNGPGHAQNITGLTYTSSGTSVSPSTIDVATLDNQSTSPAVYTITPTHCGLDLFTVQVQNYQDLSGEDMGPVSNNDVFNVVGTDMVITIGLSTASAVQGESVTVTAMVANLGSMTASGLVVSVEVDGSHVADLPLPDMAYNDSTSLTYTYTIPGSMAPGLHNVSAQITSSAECEPTDNYALAVIDIVQGTCGDGIVNNGEECDGGSSCDSSCHTISSGGGSGGGGGGGSSHFIEIILNDDMPSASTNVKRYDVVKLHYNDEVYTFRFESIYSDFVRVRLVDPSIVHTIDQGSYVLYDLDEDGEDDVKLTVLEVAYSAALVKFDLLHAKAAQGEGPVPILDFPAPKKRDRTVVSAPVETGPSDTTPSQENLLRGFITFVETFDAKRTVPVWAGVLLALLIAAIGAGLYFVFSRDKEEEEY